MNPFATLQTASKPLVARFAARPVLILFVLCLVLGLAAVVWRAKAAANAGRAHARTVAQARGAAVERQLSQALTAAEVLGALARQSGGGISNFQTVARELLASRPGLASLELQPGGVVSDIVPRAGHERAIGFNVLKDAAHRPGAYATIQRRVLTVTGPLTIGHRQTGIVVRVPVFQRGRDGRDYFWGFVAVSMRLAEALARARVDELTTQGYNYAFFAPGSPQQRGVTIAVRGALTLQDAVQQPVRAQNLEFRLALRPRGGWINATKVAIDSLGVLVVTGLLCLLANLLESRRLAFGTAEPGQSQKDPSGAKAGAAAAQAEFTLAELQERLEGIARQASENNEMAQTKLKQAELSARELQTRLDATVRAAEEAAQAKQAELEQARLALAQSHPAINELQARLEASAAAESKTAAAAQARLQQDQATIADLQARLDAAKEAAEASTARLREMEESNHEMVVSPVEMSVTSSPAIAVPAAPVEPTAATAVGEELRPVPSESQGEPLAVTPAPLAVPPATTSSKVTSSAHPRSLDPLPQAGALTSLPQAKRKSGRIAKREKVRRDVQIDLFEGQLEAGQTPANPHANARAAASDEDSGLPALELAPTSAASAPPELEEPDEGPVNQVTAQPETSESTAPQPQSEPQAASAALEDHSTTTAAPLELPVIEGLAATDGLARAGANPKLYFKALQQFVEQHADAPEKIREALLQGDLTAPERMVRSLETSAGDIGATAVESAAAALARAVREQPDPGAVESHWEELEKVVRDLVADLKPVLKPKEGKPAPARRLPAPPPVNPAQLRKAVNAILPLLADQDPGAKDCLKANRATFRSAFAPEAYEEFEQFVKRGNFDTALEQLKKAAKKQGISL